MKRICCRNLALLLAALLILLLGGCASGKEQKGAVSDSSGVNASSETDRDLSKTEKEEKTPLKNPSGKKPSFPPRLPLRNLHRL